MKASARFVSTVNRFGFGRGRVGRAAVPSVSRSFEGSGARSHRTSSFAMPATLLTMVALLTLTPLANAAPTAQSGYGYLTTGEFGAGETGGFYTQNRPANPLAVDGHGNIFVSDFFAESVLGFAPDATAGGTFLTRAAFPGVFPGDIAFDPSTDAMYLQETVSFGSHLKRFVSDGNSIPTYTLDPAFVDHGEAGGVSIRGIAVDPTTHDLLVAAPGAHSIRRFSTTGALLSTITPASLSGPESETWIDVAPDGSIYLSLASGSRVAHISATGISLGEIANAGGGPIAVNPATGVLVAARGNHLKGYSSAGTLLFETLMPIGAASGLAINDSGDRVYAYSGEDFFGGAVYTFVPAAYPGVEAPLVSAITATGAHVSAEVDPGKEPDDSLPEESELCFEYKLASAVDWESLSCQALSGPETKEADISGLGSNLDYLVRAQARNSKAGNLYASHTSDPTPFHTTAIAPKTETNDATDVSETGAVLNGTVNPVGLPTTYHFEYGTTTAYGSRVPAAIDAIVGADYNNRRLGRTITGLAPATTYHFRLVAQNSVGVSEGADRTFTTAAVSGIIHRAYEQVTPVDKGGIPIYEGFGFQAKADGSAISYVTQGGSLSAPIASRAMSFRGGADWTGGLDIDPPLNRTVGSIVTNLTLGVSSDFTHTFIATNRKLTPDAIEDGPDRANLYVLDIARGAHTLVGTAPSGVRDIISNSRADNFIAGASDFSWVVFKSPPPLISGAPKDALYRWSAADGLELISVLPDGEPASVAVGGDIDASVRSVSADGSRIYFAGSDGLEDGVFLWREGTPIKAISVSRIPGDPVTPHPGTLIGANEDGRYAFFSSPAAAGKLTSDTPEAGVDNVYRYDATDDSLEYVGAADFSATPTAGPVAVGADGQTAYWRGPGGSATLAWRNGVVTEAAPGYSQGSNASASPDGRYLAYPQAGNVYLYDAETDQRSCASCLPDGSPGGGFLRDFERYVSNRNEQAVTDTGQAFFTSAARLVAADVNGTEDVYEYKDGKNTLISPGNAPFNARFADISEDGSNIFFVTPQELVGQDNDKTVDLYDARINGGLPKQNPPPPQECLRDDCKATPNAGPELPFGGSEALSGPGNVSGAARKRCAKGSHAREVKGKTRCVKRSKAKNTKRANTNRRQGR